MRKRLCAFIMAMVLLLSLSSTAFACDESQTNTYVTQILFGDSASSKSSDDNVKMLMNALYICSEQADNLGQDKIDFLKKKKVSGIPALSSVNIKGDFLLECSHNGWEHEFTASKKTQANRRKVLQNTVNKVFDFGTLANLGGSKKGKCNSLAALLYYSHILADYLADDPSETETNVNGKITSAYAGEPYTTLNGNQPSFTSAQKKGTDSYVKFSTLDGQGRAGVAYGCIGPDIISAVGQRPSITDIKPSGWNFNKYEGIVNSQPAYVYNRCHLLAHSLGGVDQEINLITGTRYMNESGMEQFERQVADYIKKTQNHVFYRATPIYKGDNKLASGVQLEAYSVEDSGVGVSFNVFCYNVQPGIDINYANGNNEVSDITIGAEKILPFAAYNASDSNPDLILEMNKHLEILFEDQKSSSTYTSMMNEIKSIASEARVVGNHGENAAQSYIAMKKCQYEYFDVLKSYIPLLLSKEKFFKSVFK